MVTKTRRVAMSGTTVDDGPEGRENGADTDAATTDEGESVALDRDESTAPDRDDSTSAGEDDPAARRCGISLGGDYD